MGSKNTRRNKAQAGFFTVDDQRRAGVMAALKTNDSLCMLRQPVDDLTLTLVSPLTADYYDVPCHESSAFCFASAPRSTGS